MTLDTAWLVLVSVVFVVVLAAGYAIGYGAGRDFQHSLDLNALDELRRSERDRERSHVRQVRS